MSNCPTCGRRPSERLDHSPEPDPGDENYCPGIVECPDPIHDIADAGPELAACLEECLGYVGTHGQIAYAKARTILSRLEAKR